MASGQTVLSRLVRCSALSALTGKGFGGHRKGLPAPVSLCSFPTETANSIALQAEPDDQLAIAHIQAVGLFLKEALISTWSHPTRIAIPASLFRLHVKSCVA